ASVQFLLNGQRLGTAVTSAPYNFPWNTATVPNGSYTISAVAVDFAGNSTTTGTVTLTVNNAPDTTPPVVSLTNLTAGSTAGKTTILSAVASDNLGVTGVQFQANGVNIGTAVTLAPYRIAWSTSGLASGTYAITAVAYDAAGNTTTSAPINLTV